MTSSKRAREEKKALVARCGPKDRVYSASLHMMFIVHEGEDFDAVCRRLFVMAESVAPRDEQTSAYLNLAVTYPKVGGL